jgi:uncharacterized membrane protein YqiK
MNAEQVKIETDMEIQKKIAFSEQEVRLFVAEQEERSNVRELERDRMVLIEQQKLNEADQKRLRMVQEMEKKRETAIAEINQKKLKVQAETRLIEIELDAESKKRRQILEGIEVEAQQKKLLAEADAEAIRLRAQANMEAIEMGAKAEAYRLETVAAANKKSMLAEAEGRKAILLAEAEGLREKVSAQGLVNEAMILQELVQQLPNIASSMKVGDINWLNMGGGNGKDGDSPLGIVPKNLLHLMTLSKSFGLDLEGLIQSVRGKKEVTVEKLVPMLPPDFHDKLMNADPVMEDNKVVGIDFDGDGETDFSIPDEYQAANITEVVKKLKAAL